MSQDKVNQHKKEKKDRPRKLRKLRVAKVIAVFFIALAVGAGLGIPIGRAVYKYQKKQAEKYATISSLDYDKWFDGIWTDKYSNFFTGETLATNSDASVSDASASDTGKASDSTADDGTSVSTK